MSEYIIRTTNMPEHILEAVSAWYEIDCEIVRCRDCIWFLADDVYGDACRWFCRSNDNLDGFCKWGVKRTDVEND